MTPLLNIALSFILGLGALWPLTQTATAARLYLQNVPLQDEKLLIVNVTLTNVTDLYGAEVQLRYNPAQLNVRDNDPRLAGVQIKPGPLIDFDNRFVGQNRADPETGVVDFSFTLLRSATPITGEGVLATVVFEITGSGPFAVEVVDTQLVSSEFTAIPISTESLYISADTESADMIQPNSILGIRWRTMVLVSLPIGLIVLVLVGFSWIQRRAFYPNSQAPVRRMPSGVSTSIRSAALLAQQGHRAAAQGDTLRAYELFSQAIELDPANTEAWLGKGLVAQQSTEKQICLQRVLALDPDNQTALDALKQLG